MRDAARTVAVHNAHRRFSLVGKEITAAVAVLDLHAAKFLGGCPAGELSIAFLTDAALARIHDDFMKDPTATDVITFEGNPAAGQAGEICVSADTAARFVGLTAKNKTSAATQKKFSAELTLYIVHGWLHLAGYDDLQPAKKRRMRAAEKRAMRLLRTARAIPSFRLASGTTG
ncbi:MAG TPA: rRNA maturation RNase YbeY [Lacunisphaera sp.]|jgi:probable rRNA maturation factor